MRLAAPRLRRGRAGLLPMIDVVFLLLIFFILSGRFGIEAGIEMRLGGGPAAAGEAPRLVDIGAGTLRLNGNPVALGDLAAALHALPGEAGAVIVLRPAPGADVQRVVAVMDALRAAGLTALALVEP